MSETAEPTALTAIEPNALVATFHQPGGVDALLERMKRDARTRAADLDISTARGRSEIASLARTVIARAKMAWISKGKELTEDWRAQTKAVNDECKKIEAELDALRDEIRAPLTAWENAEKTRVHDHEAALTSIEALAQVDGLASEQIAERLAAVPAVDARDWQEFRARAEKITTAATNALKVALADTQARERAEAAAAAARAEEARVAAAEAQRIREERIAAEAAEAARLEAEAQARIAALKAEQQAKEAREATARAEAAAAKAEADRKAAEAKAEADRKVAAEKAQRDQEAAVEAERQRVAQEAAAAQAEADRRAANIAHRKKVNGTALAALIEHAGVSEAAGKAVIEAIARGQVPGVAITY